MIVTKTPVRLSLFGGGSDLPAYASRHGGVCVGLALDRYVYVAVKRRDGFGDGRYRVATSRLDLADDPAAVENPCVRGCLRVADPGTGVEVVHWSDVPARSGVGSSSAFAVGLLNALYSLRGEFHPPRSLWKRACHVEQDVLGEAVGGQDQAWAAWGGAGRLDFPAGAADAAFTPLPLGSDRLADLCRHLLVVYCGGPRTSSDVASRYYGTPAAIDRTHPVKALAQEGWDALCRGDWEGVGVLLDRAWAAKRGVSDAVSTTTIDMLYSTARIGGAWGGKLMGAGGGGCLALAVPPERRERCLELLRGEGPAYEIPVGVARHGSRVIYAE